MVGASFGKLTVLERTRKVQSPNGSWGQYVMARCSCGAEPFEVLWSSIKKMTDCKTCRKPNRALDLSGEVFGHLSVISFTGKIDGNKSRVWLCKCECGNLTEKGAGYLCHTSNASCGCDFSKENLYTHGMAKTPTHRSWAAMLARELNKNGQYPGYEDVVVCDRWKPKAGGSFENFLEDMGVRPEGTTLNRIHSAKIYSKETCEWASLSMQSFDQKLKSHNKSGRTGVKWREDRNVWEARITKDKKAILLYYGSSFEDACAERTKAEIMYYGFSKGGFYDKDE